MKQLITVLLILIVTFSISYSQENPGEILSNPCIGSPNTCATCIEAHPSCAWCTKTDDTFEKKGFKRCGRYVDIIKYCNQSEIVYPQNEITYPKNEALSNVGTVNVDPVQLKPQRIRLKLRPNKPERFVVQFRQAEDYPMDMYYLMDLSNSMKDDKGNLSKLGNKLSDAMVTLTSNFRLGFGSFVDKKVMPFVSTVPRKLQQPCDKCAAPYGFHNQLPLNTDTSRFAVEVEKAPISGNLDNPEGGFDAMMQAIVCQNRIGWRPKARKIIVFSTDSSFHQAGDGLLGGIVKPNDETCHLDAQNYYYESTSQDYPSISQLNRQIQKHKINVIFAVTRAVIDLYRQLADLIEGASTGELEGDSSNVVNLVRDQYNKITSSVELKDNNPSNHILVKYYSECLDGTMKERNACPGLKVGTTVSFEVEIAVTACPKDRNEWTNKTIQIYPVGLNENIEIELDMMCECDCEKPENEIPNSPLCSGGNGTFECGICSCNENRYGRLCECDLKGSDDAKDSKSCIGPGDTDKECSGSGKCRCGVCECFERQNKDEIISGEFCECNNFQCERHDSKICGGNGICSCGSCMCNLGWTGTACQCKTGNSSCIGPDGKLCSDHGNCVCGQCKCESKTDKERYLGSYCEECTGCPKQCDFYKDCVQCLTFETGKYADLKECEERCENVRNHLNMVEDVEKNEGKHCQHKDESDGCIFNFKYLHAPGQDPVVYVQETKVCPEGPNVLYIVLGVTGGIVLIGAILLIIWKVFTTIHDNKEYAKFEQERKKAQWNEDENPLYKPSTSEFQNPTFDNGGGNFK